MNHLSNPRRCLNQLFFCVMVLFAWAKGSKLHRQLTENRIHFDIISKPLRPNDSFVVSHSGKMFRVTSLKPNTEIFHPAFQNLFYTGNNRFLENTDDEFKECLVTGDVYNDNEEIIGNANLNACTDYTGILDMYSGQSYNVESHNESHFIIYSENMLKEEWSCGSNESISTYEDEEQLFRSLYSEDVPLGNERTLFEVISQSRIKFVKMLIVNDNAMYRIHGANTNAKSAQLVQRLQTLYDRLARKSLSLYPASETYSIKVSIAGMITFKAQDPWEDSVTVVEESVEAHQLLAAFSEWKSKQTAETENFPVHSVGHLISGREFGGGTVGLANLFSVCKSQSSVAINQALGFQDETIATIMAHELAHNLGIYHTDTTYSGSLVSSPCGGFIMDSNGIRNSQWSKCSVNYLKMFFDGHPKNCESNDCSYPRRYGTSSLPACLEAPPKSVWSLDGNDAVCGNGIKEHDEQCDCGSDDCSTIDPCCNGNTCTFAENDYECSNLDECCQNCYIAPKASPKTAIPCRESTSICDTPEFCDGQSSECPFDSYEKLGTECFDEELNVLGSCFIENCNSHSRQCLDYRHLGFDGPCTSKGGESGDNACGDLYCHKKGSSIDSCEKVYQNSVPVKVLDGTKCGTDKVCDSTKAECVSSSDLELPISLSCSNGVLDTDETDIDCGGPRCFPCSPGDLCLRHSDCFNNDCVNSSITLNLNEISAKETEGITPEEGCTSLRTLAACSDFDGCTWLEEFTRCKRTGEYPPSGDCFTQKKRQSCINFKRCEWDFPNERCIEIIGEQPEYGVCSGEVFIGTQESPWWNDLFEEFVLLMGENPLLGYTLLACSCCSILICFYACINCASDQLYKRHEYKRKQQRRRRRAERKKLNSLPEKKSNINVDQRKYCPNEKAKSYGEGMEKFPSQANQGSGQPTATTKFPKEIQQLDLEKGDFNKNVPDVSTSFSSSNKQPAEGVDVLENRVVTT